MRLVLVRHAVPVEAAARDDDRWLSTMGRIDARETFAELARRQAPPARLITSPLPRAVQTAELLLAAWGSPGIVEVELRLAHGTVGGLASYLDEQPDAALCLVGHEPLLSGLAAHLLGEPLPFPFGRATCVGFERPAGTRLFALQAAQSGRPPVWLE